MSGVYIKGIEMPKDYGRCMVIFPDGRVTTEFGTQVIASAIHVPDHGELIDRDKAVQDLRMDYAYAAAKIVALQPTIIPADKEADNG